MRANAASTRGQRAVAVEEHADVMAARPLLGGEIDDVTKQPAERGAKDVNDAKFRRLRLATAAIAEIHWNRWPFGNAIS